MSMGDSPIIQAAIDAMKAPVPPRVVEQVRQWGAGDGKQLGVFVDEVLVGVVYGPFEGEWKAYLDANQSDWRLTPENLRRKYLTYERARRELYIAMGLES